MIKIKFILLLLGLSSINAFGQDCSKFNRWAECRPRINHYQTYLQPKSIAVGINDTLTFNIVFEGNRDYIISFCANKLYYPIHIRLLKFDTKEEIYDNAADNYCVSIGIGFYKTQNLIVEISFLSELLGDKKYRMTDLVCVGMIMHWTRIIKNKT
ncbi:MAG: hypothetical protein EHM93_11790 [Bacteroidales bacterium]|nr:MAG: hypothetical protein EHM93_11790 [Bacteroidales bacterium]